MAQKNFNGIIVDVNEEGYLTNASQWTKEVAIEIAKEENIILGDKHFLVIDFLRKAHEKGEMLTIRRVGNSGIVDIKEFYQLFPGGPLKKASKIAGIPKPTSCI